jgi:hypothetical protein
MKHLSCRGAFLLMKPGFSALRKMTDMSMRKNYLKSQITNFKFYTAGMQENRGKNEFM